MWNVSSSASTNNKLKFEFDTGLQYEEPLFVLALQIIEHERIYVFRIIAWLFC